MIVDKNTNVHYSEQQVGAGLSELIYLLTTCYGVEDSVILMDEPSVNLHPPMMKSLMSHIRNTNNQIIVITHSPELTHYQIFDNKVEICYIRKINGISKILTFNSEERKEFDKNRGRYKHQIDSRVFFGRSIILTEGESDRNLLGISDFLKSVDPEVDLEANDVLVTSVGGKKSFKKYQELLGSFKFLILF